MRYGLAILLATLINGGALLAAPAQSPAAQPASANAGQAGTKIAFVNTSAILQGTAEGRTELAKLQEYIDTRQKAIDDEQSKLDELQKQYASQSRMLNPDTAAEMQQTITDKDRSLRRMREDNDMEVNRRRTELLAKMSQKIQTVIAEYAESNGLGAVFLDSPTMPYFAPNLDITEQIIQRYDQKHPAPASGSAAPASANPPQQ